MLNPSHLRQWSGDRSRTATQALARFVDVLRGSPRNDVLRRAAVVSGLVLACLLPAHPQSELRDRELSSEFVGDLPFLCPMDPDIRAAAPGVCSRCGMKLVLGLPAPLEYPVLLRTDPAAVRPGSRVELQFEVLHPLSGVRQVEFETVHEKLFHLFWVSHDLEEFRHEHPRLDKDGLFRLDAVFDRPGTYRLMGDFFPKDGTPQMVPLTLTTSGFEEPLAALRPRLREDRSAKKDQNVTVSLRTEPANPISGLLTLLFFELDTAKKLRKFLGAWAHMLAVKDDLITMMHAHPTIADGGKQIQMNVIFPEPGMYRIWVQVQRGKKVNTVPFTIAVSGLPR